MDKTPGKITWFDLTVPNADEIKDFYSKVVGWKSEPVSMGDYNDFNMQINKENETVAGICHARGGNSDLPPQWMIYINVADIEKSAQECTSNGGELLTEIKSMPGYGKYAAIKDPAGAVAMLFEHEE